VTSSRGVFSALFCSLILSFSLPTFPSPIQGEGWGEGYSLPLILTFSPKGGEGNKEKPGRRALDKWGEGWSKVQPPPLAFSPAPFLSPLPIGERVRVRGKGGEEDRIRGFCFPALCLQENAARESWS